MKDSETLTTRLREHADWCDDHEYEVPVCMGDHQRAAAKLIEALQSQLAESRRRERVAREDLSIDRHCTLCKHHLSEGGDCYGVSKCAVGGIRRDWQWRGPVTGEGVAE